MATFSIQMSRSPLEVCIRFVKNQRSSYNYAVGDCEYSLISDFKTPNDESMYTVRLIFNIASALILLKDSRAADEQDSAGKIRV